MRKSPRCWENLRKRLRQRRLRLRQQLPDRLPRLLGLPPVRLRLQRPLARGEGSNTYVGTPAVGTSRAAASAGVASVGPEDNEVNQGRRRFAWAAFAAFMTAWFIAFFRFFLPRTLFEPATSSRSAIPPTYGLGVDTKLQQKYRIWVDRTPDRLFVIYARCTHLGCTPDWKPAKQIQVSLPRQWIRQRRRQLRRTGAASHGPGPRGIGARRPDPGGCFASSISGRRDSPAIQRSGSVFADVEIVELRSTGRVEDTGPYVRREEVNA